MHRTDITILLQELCKDGFLISENKGRWTTYHLNEVASNPSIDKVDTSMVDTSLDKVDTSNNNMDTSSTKVDTSENFDSDSNKVQLTNRKVKIPRQELFLLILEACTDEYKTLEEIANIVNRDAKYLKNKIFPILMRDEKLKRLHPTVNHPNQAYRVKN